MNQNVSKNAFRPRPPGVQHLAFRSGFAIPLLALFVTLLAAGCAKKPEKTEPAAAANTQEVPTAEELYKRGVKFLEPRHAFYFIPYHDYQRAIDAFQEVVDNYPFNDYAVQAELQIADAYFAEKKYEEAASYYRDFADLHPDHPKVPYTIFRTGLCYYEQVRAPDRDQATTHQALESIEKLLDTYPQTPFRKQAETLRRNLRTRLAESEFLLANFYFDHEEYQAAARRFELIFQDYRDLGFDDIVLHRLEVSYAKMNRPDEAQRVAEMLRKERNN